MNNNSYLYSYIFTLLGGIMLVVLEGRENLFTAITILVGILFLVPGVLVFLKELFPSKSAKYAGEARSPLSMIVSAAAAIFGFVLIVAPHLFTGLIVYAFGILLIVCGIVQLTNFGSRMRALGFPFYYLLTPALSIAIGVVILIVGAEKILNILALITGIVLIVYGLNGLIGYFERKKLLKAGGRTGHVVDVQ